MDITLTVSQEKEGVRLDTFLFSELEPLGVSRAKLQGWIEEGLVTSGGKAMTKPSTKVRHGIVIVVSPPEPPASALEPAPEIPLEILFEDAELVVLNKPAGLVVHPGSGHTGVTLVHALLAHVGAGIVAVGHPARPGIVHRLDKDTSGLMVVAKTERAYHHLTNQFLPPRTIKRTYHAIVARMPGRGGEGTIDLPIGRDERVRTKMSVRKQGGREAVTHWRLIEAFPECFLLELTLETGRTHQIRVHLAAARAFILGDPAYGPPQDLLTARLRKASQVLGRQALHASSLQLIHPVSGEELQFHSPIPEDMQNLMEKARGDL